MKVSGFTIVRNAIKFDYPVAESIASVLPLCDEMVVAVGKSEDDTLQLIQSIDSPKIKIIETTWDDSQRKSGKVLATETDKAFAQVATDSDWAFYLQADEVVHEKYHAAITQAMLLWKEDKQVEGLLFRYKHFYGSYDYVGTSRKWYRNEIRIIKNDKAISSWLDAISFRKKEKKLNVKLINAFIYHYGWVKPPAAQQAKQKSFHKMWHNDAWIKKNITDANEYDYNKIDVLQKFTGTHPSVITDRVKRKNWVFEYAPSVHKLSFWANALLQFEKYTGWRIGEYRNYRII